MSLLPHAFRSPLAFMIIAPGAQPMFVLYAATRRVVGIGDGIVTAVADV